MSCLKMRLPELLNSLIATLGLAVSALASPVASPVAGNDARIAWMGRTELAGQSLQMAFPGVTFRFTYQGPAPTVKFTADTPDCYFNLSCNGWEPVTIHLKKGPNAITLPTGKAPAGGWLIEFVRRTESWMGTVSFDGLLLPEGCSLLPPPPWPERKLMFIGDSVTCGEFNELLPPENERSARTTNATRSYGMLLAHALNAQVHLIGYGGRGLMRSWNGKTDVNTVPVFFERSLPDVATSTWDHSRYQPDLIAVSIGTDFDASIPDLAKLQSAYSAFVERLRTLHPKAFILLCDSPFQSDGSDGRETRERDTLLLIMQAIVEARHAAGDQRIKTAHTAFQPGTPADGHPVVFQHEQIAADLLPAIRGALGW